MSGNEQRWEAARVDVRILGSLEVRGPDGVVPLGGTKQRALFAMLALQCNRVVSFDHLLGGLWAEGRPDSAGNALQVYVSRLRRALRVGVGAIAVQHRRPGYLLEVEPECIDLHRFERLAREGMGVLPDAPELAATRLAGGYGPLAGLAACRVCGRAVRRVRDRPIGGVEVERPDLPDRR